jgi:ribonuclease VapC
VTAVDSSALIAILLNEPERDSLIDSLSREQSLIMSAVNYYEAAVVALGRLGEPGLNKLRELVESSGIAISPFDAVQADLAIRAYQMFGKGIHPAGLNFGDCPAYALAKSTGGTLLFVGSDFLRTDIQTPASGR